MKQRLRKIGLLTFTVVSMAYLVSWIGIIRTISVLGDFSKEPRVQSELETCLEQFKGKSFWFLSEKNIDTTVKMCDDMALSTNVTHRLPGKLVVSITQLQPVVKVDIGEERCRLIQSSAHLLEVSAERCLAYQVPLLTSTKQELNSFVYDYAVAFVESASKEDISISKIEYKGEQVAPWYAVTINSGTLVYLPASAIIQQKVAILSASIKGLNDAQERYSVIDLRFDRVVYK
ncbi:hypothetical protein IT418_02205 [bacterium]|nr:hypothetical protein [bacterium]